MLIQRMLFKVTAVSGCMDSLSGLRVSQRLFANHSGTSEMRFYRLSMGIECAAVLISQAGGVPLVASNSLTPGRVKVTYFSNYNSLIYHIVSHCYCHIQLHLFHEILRIKKIPLSCDVLYSSLDDPLM